MEEYVIFRAFKSIAHQYITNLPSDKNYLEWYALLQHYGAPTRLLDFTSSFYIAAFFAFENANDDCAIWAINHYQLDEFLGEKIMEMFLKNKRSLVGLDYRNELANYLLDYENIDLSNTAKEEIFHKESKIFSVEPNIKNQRLALQKSCFLMSSIIEEPFKKTISKQFELGSENLGEANAETIELEEPIKSKLVYETRIIKFIIPRKIYVVALYDLNDMNINAATLFPGLDGLARSLNLIMRNMERMLQN